MRGAVCLLSILWLGGAALAPAFAQGAPPPPAPSKTAAEVTPGAPAGKKARKVRHKTEAPPQAAPASLDARPSCLDLWEPATHMTKRQWARACRSLDDRFTAATLR